MNELGTRLPGVRLFEPLRHADARGTFMELWSERAARELGLSERFVQDNVSWSRSGVLRGLHAQHPRAQGKLVTVLRGAIYDVVIDLRQAQTFGQWMSVELSAMNGRQMYVPPGFAHGFCVTDGPAVVVYKCTAAYDPAGEIGIAYDDPDLSIPWPVAEPLLSARDKAWPRLRDVARQWPSS